MLFPVQTQQSLPCERVILLYVFIMQLVHKHSMSTENVLESGTTTFLQYTEFMMLFP